MAVLVIGDVMAGRVWEQAAAVMGGDYEGTEKKRKIEKKERRRRGTGSRREKGEIGWLFC
jgi:hypothetical protein